MKIKTSIFLIVSFLVLAVLLYALTNMIGVHMTGPLWAQALAYLGIGFSGVVLWEFWGSIQ